MPSIFVNWSWTHLIDQLIRLNAVSNIHLFTLRIVIPIRVSFRKLSKKKRGGGGGGSWRTLDSKGVMVVKYVKKFYTHSLGVCVWVGVCVGGWVCGWVCEWVCECDIWF